MKVFLSKSVFFKSGGVARLFLGGENGRRLWMVLYVGSSGDVVSETILCVDESCVSVDDSGSVVVECVRG